MKINIIIKYFLLLTTSVSSLALSSCVIAGTCCNQKTQQNSTNHPSTHPNNSQILFFGKPVILDDSTHIMQQITEIVESDTMLSISGRVLTVGQVGFGINIHSGYLSLLSSTQVDDPKIKEVVEYLNSIYGTPDEDEPFDYWWRDRADDDILGWIVRMRPLHSEEGGTVLFFE